MIGRYIITPIQQLPYNTIKHDYNYQCYLKRLRWFYMHPHFSVVTHLWVFHSSNLPFTTNIKNVMHSLNSQQVNFYWIQMVDRNH